MRTDGKSIDDWYNRLDTRRTEHSRIPGIYLYHCTNYVEDGETDVDQDPMNRSWVHRTVIPDYTYLLERIFARTFATRTQSTD